LENDEKDPQQSLVRIGIAQKLKALIIFSHKTNGGVSAKLKQSKVSKSKPISSLQRSDTMNQKFSKNIYSINRLFFNGSGY